MLNELDHELERRGIKFVRYADDMILFAKTKRSAQRILRHILPYIEDKLRLKVNRGKTTVAYIGKIKFLGYGFYPYERWHQTKSPYQECEEDKGKGQRAYREK